MSSLIINLIVLVLLLISVLKNKTKTRKALMKAYKSVLNFLPSIISMMIFMGISLSIVNPVLITNILGEESGIFGITLSLILGSAAFMPSFIALPFGANLLAQGAGYPQMAGFISTLMAVGVASFPVEVKYFGKKTAFLRNTLGLIASIIFVILIWSVMS